MAVIDTDTNGTYIGAASPGGKKICLAGEPCGGSLLGQVLGGSGMIPFAKGSGGYLGMYGTGQFDGQGSGHDFGGTVWYPSHGYVNNCDGGRGHSYCDYRQQ
eukprot:CAMPEP_0180164568 /NCGR_PEP_ID=MMETSP0986-20121125/30461_1 /TAXON_ID=697907 /ORGANISM="non described non described, Strain CCMP2293" /LENGTH=101 /DNA_ID=CAMNT_0022115397 /DNA_START=57 /DNA_END=362 /DNA_ORIENTATION=-